MSDEVPAIPAAAASIIMSRLLILQSKRLMLTSAERRLSNAGGDSLRGRVKRLRGEAAAAQYAYTSSILAFGSAGDRDYWVVAYSRLIQIGRVLTLRLRECAAGLPVAERYQASTDVEELEDIVKSWTDSMHASMAASLA
jgi:hypothetical protein